MLRCTGEVVRYERKPWAMEGRAGVTRKARIEVARGEYCDVVFPESLPEPRDGDRVDLAIVPGISGGSVRLSVKGDWAEVMGAPASASPAAPASIKTA